MSGAASLTSATYRVAVWATGGVGRFAIRTIIDRPNLELVGAWVHSAQNDGEDIGTLAGIAPVGVRATRLESEILDGDADCVGFQPGENSSDQGLLATGMRAVNAIPWVCAAGPGIVDVLHQPLTSPVGALHPQRDGVPAF